MDVSEKDLERVVVTLSVGKIVYDEAAEDAMPGISSADCNSRSVRK